MSQTVRKPLRLAFVGGDGHYYLKPALLDPQVVIEAVALVDDPHHPGAAARRFADVVDRVECFGSVGAMLDHFRPTLVNTGGVYAHIGQVNEQILDRGVDVLSEKPVAASFEQLAAITAALERTGARLLTEYPFRAWPTFLAARLAVAAGHIGEPVLCTAQKSYRFGQRPDFYRRRADYGSTLLWVASHAIDVIRFVTGLEYRSVQARQGNVAKKEWDELEDHACALFELSNGGSALVHADLLRPDAAPTHGDDRLRVVGSRGQIEIGEGRCTCMTSDQPPLELAVEPAVPVYRAVLAALATEAADYSTAESLASARAMLGALAAADAGQAFRF